MQVKHILENALRDKTEPYVGAPVAAVIKGHGCLVGKVVHIESTQHTKPTENKHVTIELDANPDMLLDFRQGRQQAWLFVVEEQLTGRWRTVSDRVQLYFGG